MRRSALDKLFAAKSVALVGMSSRPDHLSNATLRNLTSNGFSGRVHLVTPSHHSIDGRPCYPDITSLPETPDVAVIMVAAGLVPDYVRQCGVRGIASAIVLTSGFEEAAGGGALAASLATVARESGVALIGPNCEGIWSVHEQLVLSFGSAARRTTLHHGPIGIISQSGSVGASVARHLQDCGCGCAYMVSVGNEAVTDCLDILAWMIERDDVRVVVMFVEAFRDGGRLFTLADRAMQRGVRLVVLKSGNSAAGRQATLSHTGKVASQYRVYGDLMRQAGIVQVETIGELVDAARLLSRPHHAIAARAQGSGVAVLSIPGGTRALTADLCERYGLPLAQYSEATVAALRAMLPPYAHAENPTDLTGAVMSDPGLLEAALEVVLCDLHTTSAVIQLANRGPTDLREYADVLSKRAKEASIPLIVSLLGDLLPQSDVEQLARQGLIVAREPADAVKYLSWLTPTEARDRPAAPARGAEFPRDESWDEIAAFCRAGGMPVVEAATFPTGAPIDPLGQGLNGPYVVKALPEHATHKQDRGLVRVGVDKASDIPAIADRFRAVLGDAGAPVQVQVQVSGTEVVVSLFEDTDFGPVLMVGVGGTDVELWGDVRFLALPASPCEINKAVRSTRLGQLLDGYRGGVPCDLPGFVAAVESLSRHFLAHSDRIEVLELNPVIVTPSGPVAVDLLLTLRGRTDA